MAQPPAPTAQPPPDLDLAGLHPLPPGPSLLDVVLSAQARLALTALVRDIAAGQQALQRYGLAPALGPSGAPVVLLTGPAGSGKTLLARTLGTACDRLVLQVDTAAWRTAVQPLAYGEALLQRAAQADGLALVENCAQLCDPASPLAEPLLDLLQRSPVLVVLTCHARDRLPPNLDHRVTLRIDLTLTAQDQVERMWELHLPRELPLGDDIDLPLLAARFAWCGGQVRQAVVTAVHLALQRDPVHPIVEMGLLCEAAKAQCAGRFDVQTMFWPTGRSLQQVALGEPTATQVAELVTACRMRPQLMGQWGFGAGASNPRGIIALLEGPPGTGKTFCAEAIAAELQSPVARLEAAMLGDEGAHTDVTALLGRAEAAQAVVLLDDAEHWLGRRDSHARSAEERQAALQQHLLLQHIIRYPGVVLLTTSVVGGLDAGLLRRVHYRVSFVEPDAAQRAQIFAKLLQHQVPLAADVDCEVLGRRFDLPGGRIHTAVLRAAYAALAQGAARLTMQHLVEAVTAEVQAAGKVVWAGAGQKPGRETQ